MSSHLLIKATTCLIFLSLFIFQATKADESILDTDGNPLTIDTGYYMVPVKWGAGGGVSYAKTQDYYSRCPSFPVTQSLDNHCGTDYGLPIGFQPTNSGVKNITNTGLVGITFLSHPPRVPYNCDQPSMNWKMVNYGNQMGASLGMFHHGGLGANDDDQSSAFKIAKNDAYGYRLTFCDSYDSQSGCGSLKPVYDRRSGLGRMVLADDDDYFMVMFVKADGRRSPY